MIEQHYLDDALRQMRKLKAQADQAMAQASDEHVFATLDPESNSIAHHHEAHGGQHAVAMDGLPDDRRRESRIATATRSSSACR